MTSSSIAHILEMREAGRITPRQAADLLALVEDCARRRRWRDAIESIVLGVAALFAIAAVAIAIAWSWTS